MKCGGFPVDEMECGGDCGVAFSSWLGMCYGVQQLPGNVTENVALCSAAGRELWRGVQRLAGNVAGKQALRSAAGRGRGGKCGAAFSGWPGMWWRMWRCVQRLAGNVAWNLARCQAGGRACRLNCSGQPVMRRVGSCSARRKRNIISTGAGCLQCAARCEAGDS